MTETSSNSGSGERKPLDVPAWQDRVRTGFVWPEHVKDQAFSVWAFEVNRSPTRASRILRDVHGLDISPDTVQRWAKSQKWDERLQRSLRDLVPTMYDDAKLDLLSAGMHGARYVRDVLASTVPGADPERAPTISRDLLNAAFGALDRVGFAPWSKVQQLAQNPASLTPKEATATDYLYGDLSTDTLLALASGDADPRDLGDRFRATFSQVADTLGVSTDTTSSPGVAYQDTTPDDTDTR